MNEQTSQQRRTVHYSGRVQGVGFRYSTRQVAARFRVVGYVQNLSDGRVRLVAEGSPDELDRFLAAVDSAMSGYIDQVHCDQERARGEFQGFDIRF